MIQKLQPNHRTIHKFLTEISKDWNVSEKFEVRFLGENKSPSTAQFATAAIDEMVHHTTQMNLTGMNSYVVINPVPNDAPLNVQDRHIKRSFFAYVDADESEVACRCFDFDLFQRSMFVTTGSKPFLRAHAYFRFSEPLDDMQKWTRLQKALIAHLKTDPVVHNPSRIMRIPGTVSYPTEKKQRLGYKPELTKLQIGSAYVE